ncbi:MAG: hypothetical protein WDN24_00185 [Sphingomonas sp.]
MLERVGRLLGAEQAIAQHEGRDAALGEPARDILALGGDDEEFVRAARHDQHRGARAALAAGGIISDARVVDRLGPIGLGDFGDVPAALEPRRAARPERDAHAGVAGACAAAGSASSSAASSASNRVIHPLPRLIRLW